MTRSSVSGSWRANEWQIRSWAALPTVDGTRPTGKPSGSGYARTIADEAAGTTRAEWQHPRKWRGSVGSNFETQVESIRRREDALDKLRTETDRQLRKYSRRIKRDGEDYVKAAFTLNPSADPEEVAIEALARASGGMFLAGPKEVVRDVVASAIA
jgi:hypothetical protein